MTPHDLRKMARGHRAQSPPAAVMPPEKCPDCGRSRSTHLTLSEAVLTRGYARASCLTCLLTDA